MKYMGSKRRIADEILKVMLSNYNGNVFVDAFCGGCHVIEKVPSTYLRIANDKNEYLIAMLEALCNGVEFPHEIPKELYDKVRCDWYNSAEKYTKDFIGWVGWMASCKGRFFDGGYSSHHAKDGRDYINEQIKNTLLQIPNLKGVEWFAKSYDELKIPNNSLVYCDIPYKGVKQYATSKDFDYEKFYEWCFEKKNQGHTVFVSEYEMPESFECVWSKKQTNSMSLTNTKQTIEKLFVIK